MADFVHLHNHTDFSLLDAAQSIDMMCERLNELKMDTIAVTEHGNLFSMIPFYKKAKKYDLKPIIGCEIYVAVGKISEKKHQTGTGKKWGYHHLVLLVQNEKGYKNLMKLVSIGYVEGFYYRPRVDKELLRKYNEGLIASSACLAGEVTHYAAQGDYERAKKAALEYAEIFPGRFYLELQNHGLPEELASHDILKKLSRELDIPLVATNDNHYAREEHWQAHDVLFCLGMGKDISDPNRRRYAPRQFYIRSADEMWNLFRDTPEALENTVRIAEQCNLNIRMGTYHLPNFQIPEDAGTSDPDEYLRQLCVEGLKKRYARITPELQSRLDYELSVIRKMNFASYFLITQDFVWYAKNNNIPVGPGRGSAAGSLVAYATGITDVDPMRYNLLFERFLNPDRVSMPDIDIDFCIERREQVINYIRDKYNKDSVAQIITFGTMKAKSVIRDVGRVLGLPYAEVDRIAKLVPQDLKMTLKKGLELSKELREVPKQDETHKNLIEFSAVLEGMHRHASTHAAGVVITPGPLTDYVPLYKAPNSDDKVTQVEMTSLEDIGLLKMDFLGLRNLTVIDKTLVMIRENHGENIRIDKIDLTDPKVYKLFAEGGTIGVFQFESQGMREYLKQLKPTCIEDLIAMNALYRPGPMENIPEFIARKHGRQKTDYLHPEMEEILKETYGIIVYQEQVMQISSKIAGFSLAQADEMRRAMGKKKAEMMAAFKVEFVEGAVKNKGLTKKKAAEIFELLEKFAQYGFNKSHSTAYAIIAYQTAWLKTYYPAEFIAANLTTEMETLDRVVVLIQEAKNIGITILPPDVNTSYPEFRATKDGKITFGLAAIKNVGHKVTETIATTREKSGKYKTIFDLCKNIEPHVMNRKALESLVMAGACDSLKGNRAENFLAIEDALSFASKFHQKKDTLQVDIFGSAGVETIHEPELSEAENWSLEECLAKEKEMIGFYLSGHPLMKYREDLAEFSNVDMENFNPKRLPEVIRVGGIISEVRQFFNKKNEPWVIISLSGIHGKADVFVFSSDYEKLKSVIEVNKMVFVQGDSYKNTEEESVLKVRAREVVPIQNARKEFCNAVHVRLPFDHDQVSVVDKMKVLFNDYRGGCRLVFHLERSDGNVEQLRSNNTRLSPSPELLAGLRKIVGQKNVWMS